MPKVEQFINEDTNLILFYLIRFDLNSGLTAARCRSPAAAGRPARTTDCCRRWSRWWSSDPSRGPRSATRTGWTGWRGIARSWRRGRTAWCRTRCTGRAGPWTRTRPASASPASWSWCWCRAAWTVCWSRRRARASTISSTVPPPHPPPDVQYTIQHSQSVERIPTLTVCASVRARLSMQVDSRKLWTGFGEVF